MAMEGYSYCCYENNCYENNSHTGSLQVIGRIPLFRMPMAAERFLSIFSPIRPLQVISIQKLSTSTPRVNELEILTQKICHSLSLGGYHVNLVWIPLHCGIMGSEQLARDGVPGASTTNALCCNSPQYESVDHSLFSYSKYTLGRLSLALKN